MKAKTMTMTILPTNNEAWGFWGTIGSHADQSEAWTLATAAIVKATGCAPEAIREFLDSRHGRHFADDVANGLFASLGLPAAIDAAVLADWSRLPIAVAVPRPGLLPGLLAQAEPQLTAFIASLSPPGPAP